MSLLVVGVSALAGLTGMSTRANADARTTSAAALLAAQKIEQLRSLLWIIDPAGQPASDTTTDLTVFPARADVGAGLTPSPANALTQNATGYCDFLDLSGRSLGGGSNPPVQAAYIRRWSIVPLPSHPADTLVLQVRVTRAGLPATAARSDDARVVAVKTRKAIR